MAANPFTRGTCPGRARPHHRGSFLRGHAKVGGRQKGTPNAISPRARTAITATVKRLVRGTPRTRYHWQRIVNKNPLISEAVDHQGQFTLAGAPRRRSRTFNMKTFCRDLSAVAMHAIQTDQFVDRDLVQCLMLLAVRAPSEFARFLALAPPKQSYLTARPDAETCAPRDLVNPGEYRRPLIPEWVLGYDLTLNSYTPIPLGPRADAAGRLPRGLRLTGRSGARLGLEVRPRGQPYSRDRPPAQNADSGMDATLRPQARCNDTGSRRPQTDPGTGLPPRIRLAAPPGATLAMGVQFQDPALCTVNQG
jgi:hypothetical protein